MGYDALGPTAALPVPLTIRYTRGPSPFSDVSFSPSFLRTTPARKPRTECCCQPVDRMIAAMVTPSGRLSSPTTRICLEKRRGDPFVRFDLEPETATFADGPDFCFDILKLLSVCRRKSCAAPPKPHGGQMALAGKEERATQPSPSPPHTLQRTQMSSGM